MSGIFLVIWEKLARNDNNWNTHHATSSRSTQQVYWQANSNHNYTGTVVNTQVDAPQCLCPVAEQRTCIYPILESVVQRHQLEIFDSFSAQPDTLLAHSVGVGSRCASFGGFNWRGPFAPPAFLLHFRVAYSYCASDEGCPVPAAVAEWVSFIQVATGIEILKMHSYFPSVSCDHWNGLF
jgi:hypothetical protein